MKKGLKAFLIVFAVIMVLGFFGSLFDSDEISTEVDTATSATSETAFDINEWRRPTSNETESAVTTVNESESSPVATSSATTTTTTQTTTVSTTKKPETATTTEEEYETEILIEETTTQQTTTRAATTTTQTTTKATTTTKETTKATTTAKATTTTKETTTKKTTTQKTTTAKVTEATRGQDGGGQKMVWIPTNGGTKYHRKSTCSSMIDPEYVTLDEAIRLGFTACGRCYK